jgi:DNA-binding MurR/RpiR family transcriptional regulator
MMDVITQIRAIAEDGSRAEQRVAQLVLNDVDHASKASIADLALQAGVSEPTITRFCRALGCEGIRDFKLLLAQALAVGGPYMFPHPPMPREEREARVIDAVTSGAIGVIERVRDTVDMRVADEIAKRLAAARQIFAYGSGGISSMIAVELQNRLFRLGLAIVAHADGQMQRMTASTAGRGTAIIAFSVSGHAPSAVEATKLARQYGGTTIAVTHPDSPLAAAAEITLPCAIQGDLQLYKPTSVRYALLTIIDIIAMMTAESIGPAVLESLRRIRSGLGGLTMTDPGRPIGD